MKLIFKLLGFLVILPVTAEENIFLLSFYSGSARDSYYVYAIARTHVDSLPIWDPEIGQPPLKIFDALTIAKSVLNKTKMKDAEKYITNEIAIRNTQKCKKKVWYYMIRFNNPDNIIMDPKSGIMLADSYSILVLMDGTYVMAKEISEQKFWRYVKARC